MPADLHLMIHAARVVEFDIVRKSNESLPKFRGSLTFHQSAVLGDPNGAAKRGASKI
jgi:hypothetical protein